MHVSRPKSSKGRSRPIMDYSHSAGVVSYHGAAVAQRPSSAAHEKGDCNIHIHPHSVLRQSSVMSMDEVAELLQSIPAPPAVTLNKYRVLPSIEKKAASQNGPEVAGTSKAWSVSGLEASISAAAAPAGDCRTLLLAVRCPSGRRFQQHFRPTDTLQMVLNAAEARYGKTYERGTIETMGVPRVSFTDLTQTLAQSGIQNRSVLCISQEDHSAMDTME
ncbi:UBX domain-containing protein 10-like [Scleropages formosus]|uniref:UBX domain protein 10 n=1 Tax=Scleropages formosus TaxID=113540 RepID=A0A0P7XFR5_SCLFO|nr:UBX domain-containing protein 10 [Scleropages formosus]KPP75061.1 UBX domain-containing protein 10-like [Scleropages formosus]